MQQRLATWSLVWLVGSAGVAWGQPTLSDSGLSVTTIASGLSLPTGVRFFGDGEALVIQKNNGQVVHVQGGTQTTVLDLAVSNNSERGLLGMELHPDFAQQPYVYLYYSRSNTANDSSTWNENRLSRFTWNGTSLVDEQRLLGFPSQVGVGNGPNHDGGPLVFGTDGKLYGITGDLNRLGTEQNVPGASSSGVGGVFRINPDGSIPADNPFFANPDAGFNELYAYGIRNSFGLAVDPVTGNLWDTENGPGDYDEVNLVARGFNSGWSQIMGPDSRDAQNVSDLVQLANSAYSDPEFSWLSTVAPTSLEFLAGSGLGAGYDDKVVVGDFNTGQLYLFQLNANRDGFVLDGGLADLVADNSAERDTLAWGAGFGATDLQVGPDGALYVTSYFDGAVYRIAAIPEPGSFGLALVGACGGAWLVGICRARRRPSG